MIGSLEVLNCAQGHMTITFNKDKKEEANNARRVIEDMLARGYTILVESDDGSIDKVTRFDAKKNEYIIGKTGDRRKTKPKRIPVASARATGIGRTAGG